MEQIAKIRIERLVGKEVFDRTGKPVGRIRELRTERSGSDEIVVEYLTASRGGIQRSPVESRSDTILSWLMPGRWARCYKIPWDKLDLSNLARPVLSCCIEDLEESVS